MTEKKTEVLVFVRRLEGLGGGWTVEGRGGRGRLKADGVFSDVASVRWHITAPAWRITAFTLQLKNRPCDNLFSWSAPSAIVCPENRIMFLHEFHPSLPSLPPLPCSSLQYLRPCYSLRLFISSFLISSSQRNSYRITLRFQNKTLFFEGVTGSLLIQAS